MGLFLPPGHHLLPPVIVPASFLVISGRNGVLHVEQFTSTLLGTPI